MLGSEHVDLIPRPQRAAVDAREGDERRLVHEPLLLLDSLLLRQFQFRKFGGEVRDVGRSVLLLLMLIDRMPDFANFCSCFDLLLE